MLNHSAKLALGYTLFILCWLFWLLVPVIALIDISGSQKAFISGALIIAAEVAFWLSLLLLGKEFWEKIKAWFKREKS